jgi:murein DD-endopeptidase MepM/ murein hydrolase activator NlpD
MGSYGENETSKRIWKHTNDREDQVGSYPMAINKIRTEHLKFPEKGGKFGPHVRGSKGHYGWDMSASPGTPVFAVGPGEITLVAPSVPGYGTIIQLKFLKGSRHYWALYAHLSSTWVKRGEKVSEGQMIGCTGRTGNARGEPPHLHFEVATDASLKKKRRNQIDPSAILGTFLKENAAGEAVVRETQYEIDIDTYLQRAHTA